MTPAKSRKTKKTVAAPNPPAPYIGAPEWLEDAMISITNAITHFNLLRGCLVEGSDSKAYADDCLYHLRNCQMEMEKASIQAQKQMLIVEDAQEAVRECWMKLREVRS